MPLYAAIRCRRRDAIDLAASLMIRFFDEMLIYTPRCRHEPPPSSCRQRCRHFADASEAPTMPRRCRRHLRQRRLLPLFATFIHCRCRLMPRHITIYMPLITPFFFSLFTSHFMPPFAICHYFRLYCRHFSAAITPRLRLLFIIICHYITPFATSAAMPLDINCSRCHTPPLSLATIRHTLPRAMICRRLLMPRLRFAWSP